MFWAARTVAFLVIARVLQGLSGAVVWTVGMALVVDTAEKDEVGAAMGYVSMAMTVGIVSGPFVGGIVSVMPLCSKYRYARIPLTSLHRLSRAGYHAVFSVAIGLILLDIILRLGMIEQKTASKWLRQHHAGETEALIRDSIENDRGHYESTTRDCPDEATVEHGPVQERGQLNGKATSAGSLPGMIRLMFSGSLLVVLGAAVVNAAVGASFDTVRLLRFMIPSCIDSADRTLQVLPVYAMKTFHWGPFQIGLSFLPLFAPSFLAPVVGMYIEHVSQAPMLISQATLSTVMAQEQ